LQTRIKKFAYLAFLIIILNPTLSLSSIATGYESLTASGYLIVAGLIIKDFVRKDDRTGDIFFYKCDDVLDPYTEQEQPHKGWQNDIIKPKRPKVTKVPIKL
jgi:hypothetical protein